jgi:hypothetical protein
MRRIFARLPIAPLLLALGGSFCAEGASAQNAVEQGQSQVIVVTPLSFVPTEELRFGQIFASNTAGTVTVAPDEAEPKPEVSRCLALSINLPNWPEWVRSTNACRFRWEAIQFSSPDPASLCGHAHS